MHGGQDDMAELVLPLGHWPSGLLPAEAVTAVLSPSVDVYLGCASGHIYCLKDESLELRLVLVPSASGGEGDDRSIVGLARGRHVLDQPHSVQPSLISLDASGYATSAVAL